MVHRKYLPHSPNAIQWLAFLDKPKNFFTKVSLYSFYLFRISIAPYLHCISEYWCNHRVKYFKHINMIKITEISLIWIFSLVPLTFLLPASISFLVWKTDPYICKKIQDCWLDVKNQIKQTNIHKLGFFHAKPNDYWSWSTSETRMRLVP